MKILRPIVTHQAYVLLTATLLALTPGSALSQGGAVVGGAGSKYKGAAKVTSITVQSNVRGAVVTNQGLAAGRAGDQIEAEAGLNEMVVSAQGCGARTFRFLAGNTTNQVLLVNLVKERQGNRLYPEPSDSDKPIALEKLSSLPSICSGVSSQAPGVPEKPFCDRKTWLEDVNFAGITWNFEEDLKKLTKPTQEFVQRLWYGRKTPTNTRYLWLLEKLFNETPGNQLVYQTLAWHSLLLGDCPRVFQIAADTDSVGILSPEMLVISALCREAGGDLKAAEQELTLAGKSSRKLPEVLWHSARLQFANYRPQAALALSDCSKRHPLFFPCNETLVMASNAGVTIEAQKLREELWQKTNSKSLTAWTKQFTEMSRSGRWQEASMVLAKGTNESRRGYEVEWAEFISTVAQRFHETGDVKPEPPGSNLLVGSVYGAEALSLQVHALKNPLWTAMSIEPLIRMAPSNKKLWYRLVDLYADGENWSAVLETITRSEQVLKESSNYLQSLKARGLLEIGRYPEALAIYKKFQLAEPNSWKSNYNLANALERSGDTTEAITTFKSVMGMNPPAKVLVAIESKLNTYEAKRRKLEARGKASTDPDDRGGGEQDEIPVGVNPMPLPPAATKTLP